MCASACASRRPPAPLLSLPPLAPRLLSAQLAASRLWACPRFHCGTSPSSRSSASRTARFHARSSSLAPGSPRARTAAAASVAAASGRGGRGWAGLWVVGILGLVGRVEREGTGWPAEVAALSGAAERGGCDLGGTGRGRPSLDWERRRARVSSLSASRGEERRRTACVGSRSTSVGEGRSAAARCEVVELRLPGCPTLETSRGPSLLLSLAVRDWPLGRRPTSTVLPLLPVGNVLALPPAAISAAAMYAAAAA
jgi:hypothetical protein